MIRAVIFDMDGVIVDSETHWKSIESDFLTGLVPGWNAELQRSIIGMSAYDVHSLLVRNHGVTLSRDEFVGYYEGLSEEIYGLRVAIADGFQSLLSDLNRERIPVAIASSSPRSWIEIVVRRFDLSPFINCYVGGDEFKGKGKPAPDIYLHALKGLGVEASGVVAIEDTEKGVRAAKAAGIFCLGYRNGSNDSQDLSRSDGIIHGFLGLDLQRLVVLADAKKNR